MARKKIVEAVRVGDGDVGRVVGSSLAVLRELAGFTQAEMAERLQVGPTFISKIERCGDVKISSLQNYVEALGAQLRIDATFNGRSQFAIDMLNAFDLDHPNEDQLVLPVFGDDVFRSQRDVVLSIRPQYSEKIILGLKTVELRRRFPVSAPKGTFAYIYSTSPVRAMVGRAEIIGVVKTSVASLWRKYSSQALIRRQDFDDYFGGLDEGYALKLSNARPLPRPLDLNELRKRFGFEPPQSYLYAKPVLRKALQDEYTNVSN